MRVFCRFLVVIFMVVFNHQSMAGGGYSWTRTDYFNNFSNPYLPVDSKFDHLALKSVLRETKWYVSRDYDGYNFYDDSFKDTLNKRLLKNGRKPVFSDIIKSDDPCLPEISIPWNLRILLKKEGAVKDKRIVLENGPFSEMYSAWIGYQVKLSRYCKKYHGSGLVWDLPKPSSKFLKYFDGTLLHNYLIRLYTYKSMNNIESAKSVIDDDILELLDNYDQRIVKYNEILKRADRTISTDNYRQFIWEGEFPFDKQAKWSSCVGVVAKKSTLEFVDIVSKLKSLSDKEIQAMLVARSMIADSCENNKKFELESVKDFPREWVNYFKGVNEFYVDDFEGAILNFSESYKDGGDLLSLSSYMLARTYKDKALSEYNNRVDDLNEKSIKDLDLSFEWYKKHYEKNGDYAFSALGMLGHIYFLKGNKDLYVDNLKKRLHIIYKYSSDSQIKSIINEYLIYLGIQDLLNDMYEVFRENDTVYDDKKLKNIIDFYVAYQLYNKGEYRKSSDMFIGLPFNQSANFVIDSARKLQDEKLEIAAINKYFEGNTKDLMLSEVRYRKEGISAFFSSNNKELVGLVAESICSSQALESSIRENINEPNIVFANRVLYKSLLLGYKFNKLNDLFSDSDFKLGEYSLIKTAVRLVSKKQSLGKAYMNIGYFLEVKESQDSGSAYLSELYPEKFCEQSLAGGINGPKYFYNNALSQFDSNDSSIDEAKALSFMINCDKSGEKGCWGSRPGNAEEPEVLFNKLHSKYSDTVWAKNTPYFYNKSW